jgi:hypothetical protein
MRIGITLHDTIYDTTGPAKYTLTIFAEAGGIYGWSQRIPLAQVPSEVLAMTEPELLASEWAAPMVIAATDNYKNTAEKAIAEMTKALSA